jgi:hypothetical protein
MELRQDLSWCYDARADGHKSNHKVLAPAYLRSVGWRPFHTLGVNEDVGV